MDRGRTNVLAFVSDCLTKIEGYRKVEIDIRLDQRRYLDAIVRTSVLPRECAKVSAHMKIYMASGWDSVEV